MKKTKKEKHPFKYPVHSIWSQWWRWFMLLALIGFILLAYGFYKQQPLRVYWQISDVLIYLIAGGLVLLAGIGLFGMKSYEVTEHDVIIRNYFLKIIRKIPRSELDSWNEMKYKDKQGNITSEKLTLKTNHNKKLHIHSTYYVNYKPLKKALTIGLKKDTTNKNRISRIWSISIGFLFIGFALLLLLNSDILNSEIQTRDNFELITGNIEDIRIESHKRRRGRRSYSLQIHLKEHRDFTFKMSDNIWQLSALKIAESKVDINDKVRIAIDKNAYYKKIAKTIDMSFWDKHSNYNRISYYGLYKGGEMLLPLSSYIETKNESKSTTKVFLTLLLLSVFLFIGGLFLYLGLAKKQF